MNEWMVMKSILVTPEMKKNCFIVDDRRNSSDHSKPNSAQISQVEDVMELGRSRHHLRLCREPQHPRDRDQLLGQQTNIFRKAAATKR